MRRTRRWPAAVPSVGQAFDVEHYTLRSGSDVLFFRHTAALDGAWEDLVTTLAGAGWTFLSQRGSARVRTFSACQPDCETHRFYGVMRRDLGGFTTAIVRETSASEYGRKPRLPGACVAVTSEQPLDSASVAQYLPIFDLDFDRDGRLDAVVPRATSPEPVAGTGGATPTQDAGARSDVEWDLYVMRDGCGHKLGTVPAVPADDDFSGVGPRGLIDLTVSHRKADPDGTLSSVTEVLRWNGLKYVVVQHRR